ncbi:MAG: Rpn family recombination-promoting nuclease/putative transposase [Bacteroidales bacterium]|jgi:predicted transposase/invertase (TIGR01784 family)
MSEITERYLNPFTDFGFKKLFGEEVNKDLLIDFLNNLLIGEQQIKDLTYLKNEHLGSNDTARKGIFDLYCENEKGEKFIVEIQKAKQDFFKDRSVYYSTFPIQEQAKQGKWNFELKAVYTIGILNFIFEDHKNEPDKLMHKIKLSDIEKNTVFYDKLTYIYLELPKFTKGENELKTQFDKWLYVLRHLQNLQDRPKALQERVFEKLFKTAEIAKFTVQERQEYEDSLKYFRDFTNIVDTAIRDAKVEEKEEMAKEMILDNEPIEKIARYTKLPMSQIEALIKEIKSSK